MSDDALLHEIATNAALHAVSAHGQGRSDRHRATLYQAHYDSVLAGLMVLAEMLDRYDEGLRRRDASVSNN